MQTSPCDIETAIKKANLPAHDTLILAPGTYKPAGELKVQTAATVEGEAGQSAPLIEGKGTFALWFEQAATVRHLAIHSAGSTTVGLFLSSFENIVERVSSTGEASQACAVVAALLIRNSLCVGEVGLAQSFRGPQSLQVELRGDTLIGSSAGIEVNAAEGTSILLRAVNTIAVGGTDDLAGRPNDVGSSIEMNLFNSNFSTVADEGEAGPARKAVITTPTEQDNQSAEPIFVDAVGRNYR